MKKHAFLFLIIFTPQSFLQARGNGGAAVAGALGGIAVGTMIGSASSHNSRRSAQAEHAEQEARRAQEKAEQLRIDRERDRIAQLEREIERRDIEHRIAQSGQQNGNSMITLLIVLVSILSLAVIVLSFFVFRR